MSQVQSTVNYREAPGDPNYRVGDDGSVWSRWKMTSQGPGKIVYVINPSGWKHLKYCKRPTGYYFVHLKPKWWAVHRLILTAFIGHCPKGMECCHNDGDKGNNALSNLRWDTPSSNNLDKRLHGTLPDNRGEANPSSKLTDETVRSMRSERAAGMSFYAIAKKHNIDRATARRIILRLAWKHVI